METNSPILVLSIYFLMTLVYSLALIEKFKLKNGFIYSILLSILIFSFGFFFPQYIENLNITFPPILIIIGFVAILLASGITLFIIEKYIPRFRSKLWGNNSLFEPMIATDLNKLKSSNLEEKYLALEHLSFLHQQNPELHESCLYGICDAMALENDKFVKDLFIQYICLFNSKHGNRWKNFGKKAK